MKTIIFITLLLFPSVLFAQQNGSISNTIGYTNFVDHKIHGSGFTLSYHSPFLLKKERIFVEVAANMGFGEGNRNFKYDPSKNYSLSNPNHPGNLLSPSLDRWWGEPGTELDLKTSKSVHHSFEILAAQMFYLKGEKHRLVVGLGAYYGVVSQTYLLDNIDMVIDLTDLDVDVDELELQYNVPFMQKYSLWSMVGSVQYHYQIGQQLYLKSDLRYYY